MIQRSSSNPPQIDGQGHGETEHHLDHEPKLRGLLREPAWATAGGEGKVRSQRHQERDTSAKNPKGYARQSPSGKPRSRRLLNLKFRPRLPLGTEQFLRPFPLDEPAETSDRPDPPTRP